MAVVTVEDLANQIKALQEAGLPDQAAAKQAELNAMGAAVAAPAAVTTVVAPVNPVAPVFPAAPVAPPVQPVAVATPPPAGGGSYSMDVDIEKFNEGGQSFGAPDSPGVYPGSFQSIIVPTNKPEQRWWVFLTNDGIRSFINVSPGGGSFKLKDILDNLKIPYTVDGSRVSFSINKGFPCQMEYLMNVRDGKDRNDLVNVWPISKNIEQAI